MAHPAEREEPRARAPLPQLHARREERLRQLRQLRRLPAPARRSSTRTGSSPTGVVPSNLTTAIVRESDFTEVLARRADADRPGRLAERLGRVQGGCLSRSAGVGADERATASGPAWRCRRRLAVRLLPAAVLRRPLRRPRDRRPDPPDAEPEWNPLDWNTSAFQFVFDGLFTRGAAFETVFVRTFVYVVVATTLSLLIAYPVAYYVARYGGRWKGLLLIGLIAPFFI